MGMGWGKLRGVGLGVGEELRLVRKMDKKFTSIFQDILTTIIIEHYKSKLFYFTNSKIILM